MREAVIDLAALRHNVRLLKHAAAPALLCAVVKADAYGHGIAPVAAAAAEAGADWFGVVDLDEARVLRRAGIRQPILTWIHDPAADFAEAISSGIDLGIGQATQLDRVVQAVQQVRAFAAEAGAEAPVARVHLKADTGLGRGGATEADWRGLTLRAHEFEAAGLIRVIGIWSHLANASAEADAAQFAVLDQAAQIARLAGLRPEVEHISASAGLIRHPEQRRGMVRIGISMYGADTAPEAPPALLGLRPVMELAATVIQVKRVPAGHGVSYGYRYVTPRETTLALLPLGYADGIPRSATGSDRARVSIRGRQYPVVGTVAMDQVVVDVGTDPVEVGDRGVIWGDPAKGHPSVQDWAEAAGTIGYELLTRVGPRVHRRYA